MWEVSSLTFDCVVLLLCCLLLLPRVLGLSVNYLIYRLLLSQPNIHVSLGGISIRRITEIRLELGSVALGPFLTARVVVSVDELAWTPQWGKLLTVLVRGAKVQLVLSDTLTPPLQPASSSSSSSLPPAAAASAVKTSIPELLTQLSSAPSLPSSLPPVQRSYQYVCHLLLASVVHSVALSLSSVLLLVTKDGSVCSLRLASLLLYIERSNRASPLLQQLHAKLGGVELRLEAAATAPDIFSFPLTESSFTSSFISKQSASSPYVMMAQLGASIAATSQPLRSMAMPDSALPPLLVLHPLIAMAEVQVRRWVPTQLSRVEGRSQGLSVHLDLARLVPALSVALQAYQGVIAKVLQQAEAEAVKAAVQSAATPVALTRAVSLASLSAVSVEAARARDNVLRYCPNFVSFGMHRISIAVFERENSSLSALVSSLPPELYSDLQRSYGTSASVTAAVAAAADATPADVVTIGPPCTTDAAAPSPGVGRRSASSASAAPPLPRIVNFVELTCILNLFQVSMKTRYPVPAEFVPILNSYDNHVASCDFSLAVGRGPLLYMSQQPDRPLLSVHSLKLDIDTSPASASVIHSGAPGTPLSPISAAITPSLGLYSPPPAGYPSSRRPSVLSPGSQPSSLSSLPRSSSLFHPLSGADCQNFHAVSLVLVTAQLSVGALLEHWLQFGLSVANSVEVLTLLVPVIDMRNLKREEERQRAADRERRRAQQQAVERQQDTRQQQQSVTTSQRQWLRNWREQRLMQRKASMPQPTRQQSDAAAAEGGDDGGIAHHVIFSVKVISGLQALLYCGPASAAHATLHLTLDELSVRLEREPYSQSKHSMHDMLSSTQDEFVSLFSRSVLPYSAAHGHAHAAAAASPASSGSSSSLGHAASTAPRQRLSISASTLVGLLPSSLHSEGGVAQLAPHPLETIKQSSRFLSVSSLAVAIDHCSSDIVLDAEGFALRYSPAVLDVFPAIFHFVLAVTPRQLLQAWGSMDEYEEKLRHPPPPPPDSVPPAPAAAAAEHPYPAPLLYLKGTVRNVTVDFPYLLEFNNADRDVLKMAGVDAEDEPAPAEGKQAAQEEKTGADSGAAATSPPAAARGTSLFTYALSSLGVSVHLPSSYWTLTLKHSYCLSESVPFLTIRTASLAGNPPSPSQIKALHVKAEDVEGEWTPAMFVGLYKLIKDLVAASINMKHGLFGDSGLALLPLVGTTPRPLLDYGSEPVLRLLLDGGKKRFVDAFRLWYHNRRARYLSEPFMHVTLDVRRIRIAAFLNRTETLSAFVNVDCFSSRNIPHHFNFTGVVVDLLQHPLVHVEEVDLVRAGLELTALSPAYCEEQHLITDYCDLALQMRAVRFELSPKIDLGPLLETIVLKLQAVVMSIWDLPSLDSLSRRAGGPGYAGFPPPPAPGLTMAMERVAFEVVDEPMESFLQHLHQLWLEERMEQERRRALLKLRIDRMRRSRNVAPSEAADSFTGRNSSAAAAAAAEHSEDEAALHLMLAEYNSRSYVRRVEELKRRMREGDSIKKASLLLCTMESMAVNAGTQGALGSFYDDDVVTRVIRARKAEEDGVWDEPVMTAEARGAARAARDELFRTSPLESPIMTAVPLSTTSTASSSFRLSPILSPRASQAPYEPLLSSLSGRYVDVSIEGIQVRLRNFPLPLLTCAHVKVGGSMAMALVTMDDDDEDAPPPDPSTGDMRVPPLLTTVSVGGIHDIALELRWRPLQFFYEMSVSAEQVMVAFSPCFAYTLNDVANSMAKLLPPLPSLYPVEQLLAASSQPAPGHHKRQRSVANPALQASSPPIPINYLHLLRSIMHGRLSLGVTGIGLHLLSSHSPYDTSRFLNVHVGSVAVSVDGPLIGVKVEDVSAIGVPHKEEEKEMLELPAMELWLTVNWMCQEHQPQQPEPEEQQVDAAEAAYAKKQDDAAAELMRETGEKLPMQDSEGRRFSIDLDDAELTNGAAAPRERQRPAPLLHIPSTHRHQSLPVAYPAPSSVTNRTTWPLPAFEHQNSVVHSYAALSVTPGLHHCCRLHLSLSITLSPTVAASSSSSFASSPASVPPPLLSPSPLPPLSVSVHSGSLATIVQFASVYSRIPPLPMPDRSKLTRYYRSYHAAGIVRYAALIAREMEEKELESEPQAEDSANDEMIGMMERGEMDGNIFRSMMAALASGYSGSSSGHSGSSGLSASSLLSADSIHALLASMRPSAPTSSPYSSSFPSVAISGLYVEHLLIQHIQFTVWEGADLGPARGIRLSIDSLHIVAEMQEETGMAVVPSDALKHSKVYLDLGKLLGQGKPTKGSGVLGRRRGGGGEDDDDEVNEISRGLDYTHGKGPDNADNPADFSPRSMQSVSPLPAALSQHLPAAPSSLIWSLSNLALRLSSLQGEIVHNAKWESLLHEQDESPSHLISSSSRVVLCTYENERYTLGQGWSARNLLPTDRPAWSNVTGTEEVRKEQVRLPSDDWEWENDWQLDFYLRKTGEVDESGWEYCNVRRRRWIRVRKLKASAAGTAEDQNRASSGGVGGARRKKRKVENADNFVLSLALLSVHQKPFQHARDDDDSAYLDWRRGLFRRKTTGRRVRGGRRRRRRDEQPAAEADDKSSSSGSSGGRDTRLKPDSLRRAQSISSVGNLGPAAAQSLLSYFHIRNSDEAGGGEEEEMDDELGLSSSSLLNASTVSMAQMPPNSRTNTVLSVAGNYEALSPLASPSPSLSHLAVHNSLPSSSAASLPPASPLLALPTQHQVRILDPKVLMTLEMRSTLQTLVEQYSATALELVQPDKKWLDEGRRQERERRKRERLEQETEQLSLRITAPTPQPEEDASSQSFHSLSTSLSQPSRLVPSTLTSLFQIDSPSRQRRGSFESTAAAASEKRPSIIARGRARLGSAEDASRRASITVNRDSSPLLPGSAGSTLKQSASTGRYSTLPQTKALPRDYSASSTVQPGGQQPVFYEFNDQSQLGSGGGSAAGSGSSTPPTATLPIASSAVSLPASSVSFNCSCRIVESETKSEAQELFCVEIINPQFNCHSEETRGRLLFMTSAITLYGRVDWVHSLHLPHVDSPYTTRGPHTASLFTLSVPTRGGSDSPASSASEGSSLRIVSRDKFRLSIVLDDVQAFVAPTDIDVDAGVIWMNKQNVGVLKSVLQPSTFQVNAVLRPEMLPVTTIKNADKRPDERETAAAAVQAESRATGRQRRREREERDRMVEAVVFKKTSSDSLLPALLSAGEHHLVFAPSDVNRVDVQLPELTFTLDAYQFSLLVDVLKTISAPVPVREEKDELLEEAVEDGPVDELKARAVRLEEQLLEVIWEMKEIDWIVAGFQQQQQPDSSGSTPPHEDGALHLREGQEEKKREQQEVNTSSSATPFGSFQSWLIETTHRIAKDREAAEESRQHLGTTDLHHRFQQLLELHARLAAEFFTVLLAVRAREAQLTQTAVHHLQVVLLCERINYLMIKNEKAFINLYVDALSLTASFLPDATLDLLLEVGIVGGRNLLPHYLDSSRPEFAWQEMVALFKGGGGRVVDSAHVHRDVMVHLQLVAKQEAGQLYLHHLELGLHPLSLRITYEGISSVIDYFVTEQKRLSTKYAKYRERFLPVSQVVLDIDMDDKDTREKEKLLLGLKGAAGGGGDSGSVSIPHSPKDGGDAQREKRSSMRERMSAISSFFHRHDKPHSASLSQLPDDDGDPAVLRADDDFDSSPARPAGSGLTPHHTPSSSLPATPHHHTHSLSATLASRPSISVTDGPDLSSLTMSGGSTSSSMPPTPNAASLAVRKSSGTDRDGSKSESSSSRRSAEPEIYFNYFRLGASYFVLSYFSGGNKKYNVEDFQGLPVKVKAFVVQKKHWTPSHLLSHVKRDMLKALLGQLTETLGKFLSYKLGFTRGTVLGPQATGGGGGGAASMQLMDKVDETETKEEDEDDDERRPDEEKAAMMAAAGGGGSAGHIKRVLTGNSNGSHSVQAEPTSTSRSGKSSLLALFGDKSKRRKDSDARLTGSQDSLPQLIGILPVPLSLPISPALATSSSGSSGQSSSPSPPPPSIPPRPAQHTPSGSIVISDGSTHQLLSVTVPADGGRPRSQSTGVDRQDSHTAASTTGRVSGIVTSGSFGSRETMSKQ